MNKASFQFKSLVIVSIITILNACKNDNAVYYTKDDTRELFINLSKKNISPVDTLKLSSLVDSVSYVCLSTGTDHLIGTIRDIKYKNNRFYISQFTSLPLLVFSETGEFLYRVGDNGRGPGEYMEVTAFDINPETRQISILDGTSMKVNVYSEYGKFIRRFSVNDYPRDMALLPNGEYLFYDPMFEFSQYHRGVWKIDSVGNYLENLVSIDKNFKWNSGVFPRFFRNIGDTVCIMGAEDKDNIYKFWDDGFSISYHVNVDIKIPNRVKKQSSPVDLDPLTAYVKCNYLETSRFLFCTVTDMMISVQKTLCFDKKMKLTYYMEKDIPFIFNMNFALALFGFCDNNVIYGYVNGGDIASIKELKPYFPNVTDESNPVLFLYYMKK